MNDSVQKWIEFAEYDLETARAMLELGRYPYVLFCCQQSVEKTLKALVQDRTGELPPRTHNLLRLADIARLRLERSKLEWMAELSAFYIQSRYPDEVEIADEKRTAEVRDVFDKTQETIRWLLSMLT